MVESQMLVLARWCDVRVWWYLVDSRVTGVSTCFRVTSEFVLLSVQFFRKQLQTNCVVFTCTVILETTVGLCNWCVIQHQLESWFWVASVVISMSAGNSLWFECVQLTFIHSSSNDCLDHNGGQYSEWHSGRTLMHLPGSSGIRHDVWEQLRQLQCGEKWK